MSPEPTISIRAYRPSDLDTMIAITLEGFDGTAIDQLVENHFGVLGGCDWKLRKARHIQEDCEVNSNGVFVAVIDDQVVGYITTRIDRAVSKGRIPNLLLTAESKGAVSEEN